MVRCSSPIWACPPGRAFAPRRQTVDKTGIRAVADLLDPKKTAAFDTDGDGQGEMWIGAETWSSTAIERIRANSYGYAKTMRLLEMPEEMGMAAVDAAEATDKPIIFACYSPHVVFKLHDIVKLDEPAYDAAKWHVVLPADDPIGCQIECARRLGRGAFPHRLCEVIG